MPNWCLNEMTIETNDKETLDKIVKLIINDQGEVDFSLVDPMPDELTPAIAFGNMPPLLTNTERDDRVGLQPIPDIIKDSEGVDPDMNIEDNFLHLSTLVNNRYNQLKEEGGYKERVSDDPELRRLGTTKQTLQNIILRDQEAHCLKTYGVSGWYDWAVRHWGTKWNAGSISQPGDDANHIVFQTAWSQPSEWFQTLCDKLASEEVDATITIEYGEGGCWLGGVMEYSDRMYSDRYFDDDELREFLGVDDDDEE